MTFEIQYSKLAKFRSKKISSLEGQDAARFQFLLALKAKELQTKDTVYKII